MSNTHEHLEHIEHSQHAAHHNFDRNIAVSMAIIAAVLACVSLLSHRAHNETLAEQLQASITNTEAANVWARFQSTKGRNYEFHAYLGLDAVMVKKDKITAEEQKLYEKARKSWLEKTAEYEAKDSKDEGTLENLELKGKELQAKVLAHEHKSHHAHDQGTRFDLGELFVELALVLSSVALLTKRSAFWYSGIAAGAIGAGIAVSAFFISAH